MSYVLALGLRVPALRRVLGRFHWPRPEHLAKMTREQKIAYIRAIGLDADARAARTRYQGTPVEATTDPGVDEK
jgi:hypothetical protein